MNTTSVNLEEALLSTVSSEIELMKSFNESHLSVDAETTVAMRMSRAIVSAICRIGEQHSHTLSKNAQNELQRVSQDLIQLSEDYEKRIKMEIHTDTLLQIWQA